MIGMMKNYNEKKAKKSSTKGVGGFRPVVKWRDIAIRRRTVVDKKVILFIVSCGIMIIIFGFVLLMFGLFLLKSDCPIGWTDGPLRCVRSVWGNTSYKEAIEYCGNQDGDLPPIYNTEQNDQLAAALTVSSWLSLRRSAGKRDFVWTATGTSPNFTKWADFPTTVLSVSDECVMIASDGSWAVIPCTSEGYIVCRFVPGYSVFVLVGPIVIVCGFVVIILSIEVCLRKRDFYNNNKGVISDFEEKEMLEDDFDTPSLKEPVKVTPGTSTSWPIKSNKTVPMGQSSTTTSLPDYTHSPRSPREMITPKVVLQGSAKSLPVPENTQSQDQLELILSPKGFSS